MTIHDCRCRHFLLGHDPECPMSALFKSKKAVEERRRRLSMADVDERRMREAGQEVDVRGLDAALKVLAAHRDLIAACLSSLDVVNRPELVTGNTDALVEAVMAAIDHIVNDDFRSPETGGGS